ncbi:hypothetical protein VKI21_01635 [Cyanobacterium aponinum UTEX 3222]|uniref:hypothetical protein n=1 Tax=Cyanobacterium aponinum TaxID=379064 RepID=UPI000C12D83B|nr:hypothetical protein [Cyanobacterium aponinum]PHV63977.1 hypothetical protein CSQ80_02825 [Cyanobacterium aponinum IPPAS B-1201]WRL42412.1 hypothetical protein VKI21_01635 [Cyanobacterium aponinum UTEX 3222]
MSLSSVFEVKRAKDKPSFIPRAVSFSRKKKEQEISRVFSKSGQNYLALTPNPSPTVEGSVFS